MQYDTMSHFHVSTIYVGENMRIEQVDEKPIGSIDLRMSVVIYANCENYSENRSLITSWDIKNDMYTSYEIRSKFTN